MLDMLIDFIRLTLHFEVTTILFKVHSYNLYSKSQQMDRSWIYCNTGPTETEMGQAISSSLFYGIHFNLIHYANKNIHLSSLSAEKKGN
jgi:hypothetical protein